MAGVRVAGELLRREPGARVTVLGAEPGVAYNRTLLTDLLAGSVGEPDLELVGEVPEQARVWSGTAAVGVDRTRRVVVDSRGGVHGYDVLVLATGAAAQVPGIAGLRGAGGALRRNVAVLQSLADCRRIVELARPGARAVVVGGGLLGLEVARALVARGLGVRVLHGAGVVMNRQLDAGASAVLVDQLAGLGVSVELDCQVVAATADADAAGDGVSGVELADGRRVECDLLVVACGTRPETGLARAAGLPVDVGVLVGEGMVTADPRVYAIGDCAQTDGVVTGLVAEAWEHARIAADAIAGPAPDDAETGPLGDSADRDRGGRASGARVSAPTRLKAEGVELTVMGASNAPDGPGVVTFADRERGLYRRIVLREGRIAGATVLGGEPSDALAVLEHYSSRSPVTREQAALLLRPAEAASGADRAAPVDAPSAPTAVAGLDRGVVVCYCNDVSCGRILDARDAGADTVAAIARRTRATTGCGICRSKVQALLTAGQPVTAPA
ncbi:NAD(P)/FAD-dependent oxidoreductase [Streptacidiphilus sp. NEAU-YB345]|uniref:NAD(P)/FAD-dependent oxidoreductase n=2 Tax=Streptacidiphilus fuscans TaxID=2789292 RepID=A0A931F9Y8_9ACTN|nr:NAD(P)/FAD-dependent oxidoreductase [Streptacidiphilus fuscans]